LESIELSAGCFDFVLHVLRHPTVNDRTAFLVDHQPEQLGDGQTFGLWVFSTASNHLATDKPEIVPVAESQRQRIGHSSRSGQALRSKTAASDGTMPWFSTRWRLVTMLLTRRATLPQHIRKETGTRVRNAAAHYQD
jgi:hypothetical protein